MNKNLLAACKALLDMTGGPEGLNLGGPIDPKTVRDMAVAAIAEAESAPLTLYTAQQGEYSDCHVVGVFSTFAAARDAAESDWHVQEWIVDNRYDLPNNYRRFVVEMDRNGNTLKSEVVDYSGNSSAPEPILTWVRDSYPHKQAPTGVWRFYPVARDLTHAIKIVNEQRAQLIAEGVWL
jgi:hypothetical protein